MQAQNLYFCLFYSFSNKTKKNFPKANSLKNCKNFLKGGSWINAWKLNFVHKKIQFQINNITSRITLPNRLSHVLLPRKCGTDGGRCRACTPPWIKLLWGRKTNKQTEQIKSGINININTKGGCLHVSFKIINIIPSCSVRIYHWTMWSPWNRLHPHFAISCPSQAKPAL